MNRDDIIGWAKEAGWNRVGHNPDTGPAFPVLIGNLERFAILVDAEKDKEIERLRADAKRLDWCISVLHSQNEKDSYLVTDTGCGCCGDGRHFDSSISGRDAIDAAMQGKGEQEQPR